MPTREDYAKIMERLGTDVPPMKRASNNKLTNGPGQPTHPSQLTQERSSAEAITVIKLKKLERKINYGKN